VQKLGENIQVRRAQIVEGEALATYVHGLKIGVIVAFNKADDEISKQVAMHVAASNPLVVNADDIPAEVLAKEQEIAAAKAAESGKPANIVEKMVEGTLKKFKSEVSLTEQAFVIDPDQKVGAVLAKAGLAVTRFIRLEVGEGIEKKEVDFAAEVAATQAAAAAAK
jgi:elongation factor Ts